MDDGMLLHVADLRQRIDALEYRLEEIRHISSDTVKANG